MKMKLANEVSEDLRVRILVNHEFLPNEKIPNERELCEEYNVSRTVIREAIRSLNAQGVLRSRHGSGTYVSSNPEVSDDPIGLASFDNITSLLKEWYTVRATIEGLVMKLVIENATDEEILEIKQSMLIAENAIMKQEPDFMVKDREFHILMAQSTHNTVLSKLISSLFQSFYFTLANSQKEYWINDAYKNALTHHRLIVEALERRDELGAVMSMRSHMFQALKDINQDL